MPLMTAMNWNRVRTESMMAKYERSKSKPAGRTVKPTRVLMRSKYDGRCRVCHTRIYVNDKIFWFPRKQKNKSAHYECVAWREEGYTGS